MTSYRRVTGKEKPKSKLLGKAVADWPPSLAKQTDSRALLCSSSRTRRLPRPPTPSFTFSCSVAWPAFSSRAQGSFRGGSSFVCSLLQSGGGGRVVGRRDPTSANEGSWLRVNLNLVLSILVQVLNLIYLLNVYATQPCTKQPWVAYNTLNNEENNYRIKTSKHQALKAKTLTLMLKWLKNQCVDGVEVRSCTEPRWCSG